MTSIANPINHKLAPTQSVAYNRLSIPLENKFINSKLELLINEKKPYPKNTEKYAIK